MVPKSHLRLIEGCWQLSPVESVILSDMIILDQKFTILHLPHRLDHGCMASLNPWKVHFSQDFQVHIGVGMEDSKLFGNHWHIHCCVHGNGGTPNGW